MNYRDSCNNYISLTEVQKYKAMPVYYIYLFIGNQYSCHFSQIFFCFEYLRIRRTFNFSLFLLLFWRVIGENFQTSIWLILGSIISELLSSWNRSDLTALLCSSVEIQSVSSSKHHNNKKLTWYKLTSKKRHIVKLDFLKKQLLAV